MLKKAITFEDFDGNEQTREFYFNLSAAEMADMELNEGGTMSDKLKTLLKEEDMSGLLQMLKDIITKAYGVRDGERFIKSDEISMEFMQSPAFDALFFELATQENAGNEFMTAIVPKQLRSGLQIEVDTTVPPATLTETLDDPTPWLTEDREPTKAERQRMTKDQLIEALKAREARRRRTELARMNDEGKRHLDPELAMLQSAFED